MDVYIHCKTADDVRLALAQGWKRLLQNETVACDGRTIDLAVGNKVVFNTNNGGDLIGNPQAIAQRIGHLSDWMLAPADPDIDRMIASAHELIDAGARKVLLPISCSPEKLSEKQVKALGPSMGVALTGGLEDRCLIDWGVASRLGDFHLHLSLVRGDDALTSSVACGVSSIRLQRSLWNAPWRIWQTKAVLNQQDAFPVREAA